MKWILDNKKEIMIGSVTLLLLFVLTISFHFFKEEQVDKNINKEPVVLPEVDDLEFANESSLSVDEIWDIVEEKKGALRNLFYDSKVYEPHEIDPLNYTVSDNERYVVFDGNFVKVLNELVTEEIYNKIINEFILIKDQFYIADSDIFDSIYLYSAIAEIEVISSETRLVIANDEVINASVLIQVCEDEDTECNDNFSVPFELTKVDNIWKISSFERN